MKYMNGMRWIWRAMFIPPWRKLSDIEESVKENNEELATQITIVGWSMQIGAWLLGWLWSIMGLILGAFIATPLLTWVGLVNTPYQNWGIYGLVALCALVVQIGSFGLLAGVFASIGTLLNKLIESVTSFSLVWQSVSLIIVVLIPLGAEFYALYRFVQTQNLAQGTATTYVIGGFIVKAILFPALKGFLVGIVLKRIWAWIKGEDRKA